MAYFVFWCTGKDSSTKVVDVEAEIRDADWVLHSNIFICRELKEGQLQKAWEVQCAEWDCTSIPSSYSVLFVYYSSFNLHLQ